MNITNADKAYQFENRWFNLIKDTVYSLYFHPYFAYFPFYSRRSGTWLEGSGYGPAAGHHAGHYGNVRNQCK